MTKSLALLAALAVLAFLLAGCTSNPVQGDPALPPGFQDAKVPKADLNAYVYVSQGAPVSLPTRWFGDLATVKNDPRFAAIGDSVVVNSMALAAGTDTQHAGGVISFQDATTADAAAQLAAARPLTQAWRNGNNMGLAHGDGDWPGALKASLQAGNGSPVSQANPDAWDLLRMLPQTPPSKPVAAGYVKVDGNLMEDAAGRLQLNLSGVTQALGSLNVSQVAFIAYAAGDLSTKDPVSLAYLSQRGASALLVMKSSYPGFLLGFFLNNFASQAGLEKGEQVAGQDVLTKDLGDAYLVAKPIGSVLFLSVAPDKAHAEALMESVLKQQGK